MDASRPKKVAMKYRISTALPHLIVDLSNPLRKRIIYLLKISNEFAPRLNLMPKLSFGCVFYLSNLARFQEIKIARKKEGF